MSEAVLQRMVIDLARWCGFLAFHDFDSRRNTAGFLDLVLIHTRTGRLLFVELKSATGRVRPEQVTWMRLLGIRHEVHLWRPADWESGEIRRVLTDERQVSAA